MASLSLPRVLQLKKNSLDAEREQFEKFQTLAIQKAINSNETPVKEKHVRSTIIGTFQEQSAITYWMVAIRLPLQDNRIVSWKFCHVTHKLLREGHPACLDDSQRHIGMIENLGKLWVHLREGYGRLIHLYSNLLVTKLKFHARNPRFPGNMLLTADELDAIAENDVNNYFQLCVELFDYMEDILSLQAAVFDSLGNARANSMTASGQCRLAALIPCAQDSSHIYDCNVRLLFRLHAALPPDVLAGHRERFRQQFKKLSSFYKHASSLQYYRNLLTLPVLPSNPPNFLLQSDFGTYVTPVVSIPEQPQDEVDTVGSLIDTSDTISQRASPERPEPDPIVERDRLIDHLQNELKRMRLEVSQIIQERNTMLGSMREHCTRLESQLRATRNELEEEKQKMDIMSVETPEIKKKLTQTEEKAKILDEKFQKLKGAYTQLREEHIALIRQKAEVDKNASSLRAAAAQHESAKTMLQQQLNDRMKDVELLQQSASSSEEIEAYKSELTNLRTELEQARQKEVELETLRASMEALEIEHKTATTELEVKLTAVTNELKEVTENNEKIKQEISEKDVEYSKVREELICLRQKSGDEYKKAVEEREDALKQLAELQQQYQHEKQEQVNNTNNLQADLETFKMKLTETQSNFERQCSKLDEELSDKNQEFESILKKKEIEIEESVSKLTLLQSSIESIKSNNDELIRNQADEINGLKTVINVMTQNLETSEKLIVDLGKQIMTLNNKLEEEYLEKTKLTNVLTERSKEVSDLQNKIKCLLETLNNKDTLIKEIEDLKDKESKDQLTRVEHLEESIQSKDNIIDKLSLQYQELSSRFEEKIIEIDTIKNDYMIERKSLESRLEQLSLVNDKTVAERDILISEKQDLESIVMELKDIQIKSRDQIDQALKTNTELEATFKQEIENIKLQYESKNSEKDNEIKILTENLERNEVNFNNIRLSQTEEVNKYKTQIEELEHLRMKEREEYTRTISEKESKVQLIEARLEHTESERLNAECELQDLLQQNTILEADMGSLKIQLEEAKQAVKKQTSKLVSCAGETALEVMNGALSAFENSNAQDANNLAAELAIKALEELTDNARIEGKEEDVAKSAIFAAHNAAKLSAYIADLSNITTDIELSDKLNTECREMLTSTKLCLEALSGGAVEAAGCAQARAAVQSVLLAARGADAHAARARCVDDELADMDRAIEAAAAQIEKMLAASRAGDTGIKLEVNEKILDACTTLMAAVKILVQDSRKLQNELGDPKTRQKMYRRNPQWSEGLISASKAVVFAAKLLVTSADEAVGAAGRVEGVSAAAHEVAASTAQLVAASRAKAPPAAPALASLTAASRAVAAAAGAVVASVRGASALVRDQEALDTSALSLTATRRLEMESKVRALELESALDAERARLAALRKRHYHLAQLHENGKVTNGEE
ncbi:huntingtin-interacting protein 1-related protein isoform X1 [Vanessa atalanta]|uniref:huntingtin-interacting protein 1-related protein isoform X1 n=2 Tax=Vanessa atalanta TaxID=42275 RepID=UPI001FCDEA6B|nr:huntingtin-interacting protein 1-related protein isoform X1 [Vanessa atalanta]